MLNVIIISLWYHFKITIKITIKFWFNNNVKTTWKPLLDKNLQTSYADSQKLSHEWNFPPSHIWSNSFYSPTFVSIKQNTTSQTSAKPPSKKPTKIKKKWETVVAKSHITSSLPRESLLGTLIKLKVDSYLGGDGTRSATCADNVWLDRQERVFQREHEFLICLNKLS